MAKRKGQDRNEELESYLTDDFNVEIYDELIEGNEQGLFEPLEFFRLLYAQHEFVKANKAKPLTVIKHLTGLKLTDDQKWFLLDRLSSLFRKENHIIYPSNETGYIALDKQLEVCCDRINKEISKLEESLFEQEPETDSLKEKFDFNRVKQHIESLPDLKAKIKYLTEISTEYQQQDDFFDLARVPFDDKCKLEMLKLLRLENFEKTLKPKTDSQARLKADAQSRDEVSPRNREFTMARQTLAMYFLLQYAKAECPNTDKADFIAFLTGKSRERIRQTLSHLYQTKEENYTKWEKDMKYVRKHFEALGLSEVVKMIDNELSAES